MAQEKKSTKLNPIKMQSFGGKTPTSKEIKKLLLTVLTAYE